MAAGPGACSVDTSPSVPYFPRQPRGGASCRGPSQTPSADPRVHRASPIAAFLLHLMTTRPHRSGPRLAALVLAAVWVAVSAGCGAAAKCPAGTVGPGCIPVTDLGEQPELPESAHSASPEAQDDGLADGGPVDAETSQDTDTDTDTEDDGPAGADGGDSPDLGWAGPAAPRPDRTTSMRRAGPSAAWRIDWLQTHDTVPRDPRGSPERVHRV